MNISVIIPQVFYDLIARVFPGVFFTILALLSLPDWAGYLSPLASTDNSNIIQSLGKDFIYAVLCYFLGWLFVSFSSNSAREKSRDGQQELTAEQKEARAKDLDTRYQWIRLAHNSAGFRIVKLRAEARMFQASQTGMLVLSALAFIYIVCALIFLEPTVWPIGKAFWLRPTMGIFIAAISFLGFRICERKAWGYYWGNVDIVYNALHNVKDPIPHHSTNPKDT